MQVRRGANRRLVGFGSVDGVVNGQEMLVWKRVHPFHQQRLPGARLQCWTGGGGPETPEPGGLQVAMNFAGDGLSLDSIKRDAPLRIGRARAQSLGLRDFRDRKRVDKLRESVDIE